MDAALLPSEAAWALLRSLTIVVAAPLVHCTLPTTTLLEPAYGVLAMEAPVPRVVACVVGPMVLGGAIVVIGRCKGVTTVISLLGGFSGPLV